MIKAAFHEEWWHSSRLISVNADGSKTRRRRRRRRIRPPSEYTLIQYNFTLFFGLAIQMYEATLVSDDTPWDRFRRENPSSTDPDLNPWTNTSPTHISRLALFGAHLFNDRTRGADEHALLELPRTGRADRRLGPPRRGRGRTVRCATATATSSTRDSTTSASVRPPTISASAPAMGSVRSRSADAPVSWCATAAGTFRRRRVTKGFGVDGAFKIPSLRNVALTAPYFHNGDARTLREVVELYSRGGNVAPIQALDGTPIEPLGVPTLDPRRDRRARRVHGDA